MDLVADRARYQADRAKDLRLSRTEGLDAVFASGHRLDAVLFPGGAGAGIAAKAGYPTVLVPFGLVPNAPIAPAPPSDGWPGPAVALRRQLHRPACSEPRLLALAYAFEQASKRRIPPPAFP